MKAHAETHASSTVQRPHTLFFRKGGEGSFFSEAQPQPFFRPPAIQRIEDEKMGLQTKLGPIQAKLTIGQPGDRYEQEANQMADAVVNGF